MHPKETVINPHLTSLIASITPRNTNVEIYTHTNSLGIRYSYNEIIIIDFITDKDLKPRGISKIINSTESHNLNLVTVNRITSDRVIEFNGEKHTIDFEKDTNIESSELSLKEFVELLTS